VAFWMCDGGEQLLNGELVLVLVLNLLFLFFFLSALGVDSG
jgi:hypothetical protein